MKFSAAFAVAAWSPREILAIGQMGRLLVGVSSQMLAGGIMFLRPLV